MALPRPSSPKALLADLRAFARERRPHQWIAAILAIVMPVVILVGFYLDSRTNIAPGEQLIYVENWRADRTDAEIIAQQKIDQAAKEKRAAERQRQFQKLEKQLGI
ncbi:hypothetical protein IC614_10160 [Allosphingosinicella flava]|uniref:Uncharacterized protein n=1 Tax=Allosphingosinicella flava TaxID=2771430 RepID=A0A7T2GIX4_9SPHN|nr:hypothetical protein [Sphingosinicella flava]QPQ54681.1 hypothetical protein IC614_10160 [Sphingosinicella flava]